MSPRPAARSSRFSTAQLRDALAWLGRQPAVLFLFVLALNALRYPYQGRVHDATLYSFQALNRLSGGQFTEDLFFKYGSQDRFSAFSALSAPLLRPVGLDVGFFLLFILSAALFFWAVLRLARAITDDAVVTALAGIVVAVTSLWFGGLQIFRVNEAFFTPRLPASALSVLALERVLRGRPLTAAACLAAALVIQPLMAGGAILVCLTYWSQELIKERGKVIRFAAITSLALVSWAVVTLSDRYFPVLDDTWRAIIREASPYNFPADWNPSDWVNVACSIAIVSIAARLARPGPARRLLAACVLAAVGGLVLTCYASISTHSLLFQIQPYRALWLLAVIQVPCAMVLMARWWPHPVGLSRFLVLFLAAYLLRTELPSVQLPLTILVFILCAGLWLLFGRRLSLDNALLLAALSIASGMVGVDVLSGMYLVTTRVQLATEFDPVSYVRLWLGVMSPLVWLAIGCLAILVFLPTASRVAIAGLLAVVVVVHATAMAIPAMTSYKRTYLLRNTDLDFVGAELRRRRDVGRGHPTIYMNWSSSSSIWEELGSNSYFHLTQVVGVMFSRGTAIEAKRRAALAAPFEIDRYTGTHRSQPQIIRLMVERLFDVKAIPSVSNLEGLCADRLLDFVILKDPPFSAKAITNGSVRIHDCRDFRPDPR